MSGLNEGEYYSYCFGNNGFCGESYNYTFKVPPTGDTPVSIHKYLKIMNTQ